MAVVRTVDRRGRGTHSMKEKDVTSVRTTQRLAAVLRDSSDAITVHDAEGTILAWNRGAQRFYGYSESEALGMTIYDLVPEELQDEMRAVTRRVMAERRTRIMDTVRQAKDGRKIQVGLTATPLLDETGHSYAVATTERNITLEQMAHAQRRQAALAHQERLTTAGEMAAGLAHELNQPLTAIMHFCDLMKSILEPSRMARRADALDALGGIAQQADRAGEIIRNLRQFVGRAESHRRPCDINEVVRETVSFINWDLEQQSVSAELQLADGLPQVTIDRSQIEQVLVNLMRNGIESMAEAAGGPTRIVLSTVLVTDDSAAVRVTVHDSGPGISEKVRKLLFDPFKTTKANGLGMGLWIARSIVEAHGGRLWADRDDGTGATFHFTLPIPANAAGDRG